MKENTLHIGLCLPKSCSNEQIFFLLQKVFAKSEFVAELGENPKVLDVKDLNLNPQFYKNASLWIFFGIFFCISLLNHLARKLEKSVKKDENNNVALGVENEIKLSLTQKIISCFNQKKNKKYYYSGSQGESTVDSISGLRFEMRLKVVSTFSSTLILFFRFFSCFLIAISHVVTFSHFSLPNKISYFHGAETVMGIIMTFVALLVDG